jgi:hypothetical protein
MLSSLGPPDQRAEMPDPSLPARVYGDKEIARILERATELQSSEASVSPSGGMTLAELEEVAAEAGIDVQLVRRAALEVEAGVGEASVWERLLGERVSVTREILLPGELQEKDLEQMLAVIQSAVRDHGQPSLVGRTLTWQGGAPDNSRRVRVVVSSRDGQTEIRVEEGFGQLAGGLFGGIVGGVGIGFGVGAGLPLGLVVLQSAAVALAAPLAIFGLTYLGVRDLYRKIVRGQREILDRLFEQLVRESEETLAAPGPDGP